MDDVPWQFITFHPFNSLVRALARWTTCPGYLYLSSYLVFRIAYWLDG